MDAVQFGRLHWREARILQCRSNRMFTHILHQWLMGLQGTDAAAQLVVDGQCDKGGTVFDEIRSERTLIEDRHGSASDTIFQCLACKLYKFLFFRVGQWKGHAYSFCICLQ